MKQVIVISPLSCFLVLSCSLSLKPLISFNGSMEKKASMKGGRAWFGVDLKSLGFQLASSKEKSLGLSLRGGGDSQPGLGLEKAVSPSFYKGWSSVFKKGTGKFLAILGSKEREASNFSYVVMKREDFACAQFLLQKREGSF